MTDSNKNSAATSRRGFFKKSGLTAFGLAAAGGLAKAGEVAVARAPRSGKAKNIIFLVSDGMSQGTLTLADLCTKSQTRNAENACTPVCFLTNSLRQRRVGYRLKPRARFPDSKNHATQTIHCPLDRLGGEAGALPLCIPHCGP